MVSPLFVLRAAGYKDGNIGETTDGDKVVIADWHSLGKSWGEIREYTAEQHQKLRALANRVESIIRQMGYECYFDDQLILCDNCYKYASSQPGYYGDLRLAQVLGDSCEVLCPDCVLEYKEDYLADKINNPSSANTILNNVALAELGWKQIETDFEHGFHPGQNDDPNAIYKRLKGSYEEILFSVDGAGQFDISFSVWGKNDD